MTTLVLFYIFLYNLLPFWLAGWLWLGRPASRTAWLMRLMLVAACTANAFLTGQWTFVPYLLRCALPVAALLAAAVSWSRARSLPWHVTQAGRGWAGWIVMLGATALALQSAVLGVLGRLTPPGAVDLAFPLRDGTYVVAHGGNAVSVNYHNEYPDQRYALDIVALNRWGMRAEGIFPARLDGYAIYGHTVYSPCAGRGVLAADGQPEMTPPDSDPDLPPGGNLVAIACKGVTVFLAHLQQGSLMVQTGDQVAEGQPIGRVGNSGNSTEPHLHIHAERGGVTGLFQGGTGVPITFGGRWLVRSSLVRAGQPVPAPKP